MNRLLIHNIKQVVKVCENGELLLAGKEKTQHLAILDSTSNGGTTSPKGGYSILINDKGTIEAIDTDDVISEKYKDVAVEKKINAGGKCVLPGLIDGHTHPVWLGDRVHEFKMKLAGASYMDIHQAGGGIHFTVDHVHKATEEELYQSLKQRLHKMVKCGTTTVEAKSGYGLDKENELKMLRVINRARNELSKMVDISITYCGAHAIPKGKNMKEATTDILTNQLPCLKQEIENGRLHVDNIDVFCEKGVFDTESTRQILEAGVDMGLNINFHGDELHPMKSGELGGLLNARAISHLEEVSDAGVECMADKGVVAVLLPTTAYILRLKPPPARKMIEQGVPVALGSDFNPNAFCYSMPMVMHMACCLLKMSMNEALIGATINAAASIGLSRSHGSIEVGKQADLLVVDVPSWEHLIYQFGCHGETINYVIKNGKVVHQRIDS